MADKEPDLTQPLLDQDDGSDKTTSLQSVNLADLEDTEATLKSDVKSVDPTIGTTKDDEGDDEQVLLDEEWIRKNSPRYGDHDRDMTLTRKIGLYLMQYGMDFFLLKHVCIYKCLCVCVHVLSKNSLFRI